MLKKKKLNWKIILFFLTITLLSLLKLTSVTGSKNFFLRSSTPLFPILPNFLGILGTSVVLLVRILLSTFKVTTISGILLSLHIPSALAAVYFFMFQKNSLQESIVRKLFLLIYPILSIILFCIHPVGKKAFIYSAFWLIPIIVILSGKKNIWLVSLSSTFVAHSTGSILWLYLGLINDPKIWISLIPIVFFERITFTFYMTFFYRAVNYTNATFGVYKKNLKHYLMRQSEKQKGNYVKKNYFLHPICWASSHFDSFN